MSATDTATSLPFPGMDPQLLHEQCERLRTEALFGEPEGAMAMGPLTEQYYLLAVGALEQAQRFAMLAEYHSRRGD